MFRTFSLVVLSLTAGALATPLSAEPTPGPPDWQDGGGSVYLDRHPQSPPRTAASDFAAELPAETPSDLPHELPRPVNLEQPEATPAYHAERPHTDHSVAPAVHEVPAAASGEADARRLAPPSGDAAGRIGEAAADPGENWLGGALRKRSNFGAPLESIYTILSATAIVVGAFLMFAWFLRRSGRNRSAALPAEVVSVLGRVPLAARQFAELLRVGNKLVLVSLTPTGAETLTEVTDPVEVDRLLGLCQQYNPHSTTKAFEQVFRQLSSKSTGSGLFGHEPIPTSTAAAYRAHREDAARG